MVRNCMSRRSLSKHFRVHGAVFDKSPPLDMQTYGGGGGASFDGAFHDPGGRAAPLSNTDQGIANLAKADRHACRHAAPSNRSFSETKSTNEETARAICLRFGKAAYTLAASCRYSPSTLTRRPASISATHSE
jgi:hypothetical protein